MRSTYMYTEEEEYEIDRYNVLFNDDLEPVKSFYKTKEDTEILFTDSNVTPLMVASCRSSPEVIKYIVSLGADLNAKDREGFTPVHWAANRQNARGIKTLAELGADLNQFDNMGELTPLGVSLQMSRHDSVAALVNAGADLEITNSEGYSPIEDILEHEDYEERYDYILPNIKSTQKYKSWINETV